MTDDILEAAVRLTEALVSRVETSHLIPTGARRGSEVGENVGQIFTVIFEAVQAAKSGADPIPVPEYPGERSLGVGTLRDF